MDKTKIPLVDLIKETDGKCKAEGIRKVIVVGSSEDGVKQVRRELKSRAQGKYLVVVFSREVYDDKLSVTFGGYGSSAYKLELDKIALALSRAA